MKITEDIIYVGVNDHDVDLFEGQYIVPNGMAYNSYVIRDEKIAVMDTVDGRFAEEWLANIEKALDGATPDYLIVQHMEPDHAANIQVFAEKYPSAQIVGNAKTFTMMKNFFHGLELDGKTVEVKNGETLNLGKHELTFVFAPMVHWPEVMVTYDSSDKVLFSADGFGKFGRRLGLRSTSLLYWNCRKIWCTGTESSESSCNTGYSDYLPITWTGSYRESWTLYREVQYLVFLWCGV